MVSMDVWMTTRARGSLYNLRALISVVIKVIEVIAVGQLALSHKRENLTAVSNYGIEQAVDIDVASVSHTLNAAAILLRLHLAFGNRVVEVCSLQENHTFL